jgi:hypothetical protein
MTLFVIRSNSLRVRGRHSFDSFDDNHISPSARIVCSLRGRATSAARRSASRAATGSVPLTTSARGSRASWRASARDRTRALPMCRRRGWRSLFCEPSGRLGFWEDGEDFDRRFGNVIKHPDVINS